MKIDPIVPVFLSSSLHYYLNLDHMVNTMQYTKDDLLPTPLPAPGAPNLNAIIYGFIIFFI